MARVPTRSISEEDGGTDVAFPEWIRIFVPVKEEVSLPGGGNEVAPDRPDPRHADP